MPQPGLYAEKTRAFLSVVARELTVSSAPVGEERHARRQFVPLIHMSTLFLWV